MQGRIESFRAVAGIQGRRPFVFFGAVTLVVVFLLAALQIASRYALKEYVEDQLARMAWDISVYQVSELPLASEVRRSIANVGHVTETQNIFFLRTAVPTTTVAYVDGQPLRSPWLSLLAVSNTSMLPPELRPQDGSSVLVLVGSKSQMGDAFLKLQNRKRFELRVERHQRSASVFSVPLERTVRLDRNEVNRWFMDQTSSPTLVPELGVILVVPHDPQILAAYDAVSRGIKHHHGSEPDDIHADAGEYFPDIIHLARLDRGASPDQALGYLSKLFEQVPVLDKSAREALQTFSAGKGDVLIAYENEAITAQQKGEQLDYVVPDQTILIENPIAVSESGGAAARAFVAYLRSPAAQRVFAEKGYRSIRDELVDESTYPTPPGLFTIADLGGWSEVQKRFFDRENGIMAGIQRELGAPVDG